VYAKGKDPMGKVIPGLVVSLSRGSSGSNGKRRSAGEQPLEMALAKGYIHDLRWSVLLSFTLLGALIKANDQKAKS
jgi:hypothetical protein